MEGGRGLLQNEAGALYVNVRFSYVYVCAQICFSSLILDTQHRVLIYIDHFL